MIKFEALFDVVHCHLDLCMESLNANCLITSCIGCPFREFKDYDYTCVSMNIASHVFDALPVIYGKKRGKKKSPGD